MVITLISNKDGVDAVHGHSIWLAEARSSGLTVYNASAFFASSLAACHRRHAPVRRHHLADAVKVVVSDDEVSVHVHHQSSLGVEAHSFSQPIRKACFTAIATQRRDHPICGCYIVDAFVAEVADIDSAVPIHYNAPRVVEACGCAHAVGEAVPSSRDG